MKKLIFEPKPNATADEAMQVLNLFTLFTMPPQYQTNEVLFELYNKMSPEVKRHFKVEDK